MPDVFKQYIMSNSKKKRELLQNSSHIRAVSWTLQGGDSSSRVIVGAQFCTWFLYILIYLTCLFNDAVNCRGII